MLPMPLGAVILAAVLGAGPGGDAAGLPALPGGLPGPLARVDELLAAGRTTEAAAELRAVLGTHPPAAVAAEAAYKLGAAYLLDGLPEQASQAFARLAREHGDSFWARLALSSHVDLERLKAMAGEAHKEARQSGRAAAQEAALRLWRVVLRRLPAPGAPGVSASGVSAPGSGPSAANPTGAAPEVGEVLYKIGDLGLRLGRAAEGRDALARARQADPKGDWGKLADFRLAGTDGFVERLPEFFRLTKSSEEAEWLVIELAGAVLPGPDGEAARRCRLARARAAWQRERTAEAVEDLREVARSAAAAGPAAARDAAEARFWLAEKQFRDGEFAAAAAAFRDLARDCPDDPRAAQARAWAEGLDEREPRWAALREPVHRTVKAVRGGLGGLALRLEVGGPAAKNPLQVRLAFRDADHVWVSLTQNGSSWLLANNDEGGWVQSPGQPLTRLKKKFAVPTPSGGFHLDPGNGQASFAFHFNSEGGGRPRITMPEETARHLVTREMRRTHLGREAATGADGRPVTLFRLQRPDWDPAARSALEVEVSGAGTIARLTYRTADAPGRERHITLSDLALNDGLPESAFAVPRPAGTAVVEAEEANYQQVFMPLMQLFFSVLGELNGEAKR